MNPTMTRMLAPVAWVALIVSSALAGCASGGGLPPAEWHAKLNAAMATEVSTPAQGQEQSRLLQAALDDGALDNMIRPDVQAAIGKGMPCRNELCEKQGFSETDWYYELGVVQGDAVKQLPVLIVGFDQMHRATRIWNLTTH
jgi:hypothetical protein